MTKPYTLIPYTMKPLPGNTLHTRISFGIETGIRIQRLDHETLEPINIKPSKSTVSRTGRTGERWWDIPIIEDVYLVSNPDYPPSREYVVKEGEQWYRFEDNSIASVKKYLEDKQ